MAMGPRAVAKGRLLPLAVALLALLALAALAASCTPATDTGNILRGSVVSPHPRARAFRAAPTKERTPMTRKGDVVTDYHGTRVADPYQWLEDGESGEVKAWTALQNAATRAVLDAEPGRAELKARVNELLEVGALSLPAVRLRARGAANGTGAYRLFHSKREGAQNQPVYYVRDGIDGQDRPLIDVAALSKDGDGTTALDWAEPSHDGALVAWGRSEGGSEESTLYVRDVATGRDLADVIPHTQHASVAWLPDGSGFYYTRYPNVGEVPPGDEKYFRKVFFHKLGSDPKGDPEIFGAGRDKTDTPSVMLSPDGRYLVVRVHEGWQKSEVYVCDRTGTGACTWLAVARGRDALFEPIVRNDALYILTNDGAPRSKLYRVGYPPSPATSEAMSRARWTEVLGEAASVLHDVTIAGSTLVATYMDDAATRLERFTLTGKSLGPIALPSLGTAAVSAPDEGDFAFVYFTSFVTPPQVLHVALGAAKEPVVAPWDRVGAGFKLPGVVVSRVYATSKDGTKVPMFVVENAGTPRDGTNAAVLWGYGGFNQNMTPAFSARALATVERGGVWASAVLRGGGELGEAWHRGGMLANKQNVFDDFIACAEELVRAKVTTPARLAIAGGSNGGLLTAAVAVQRPDLFRAGLSLVPLTDMLRYHHFRIAKLWIPEYGSADDAEQFKTLFAYSPYHRVRVDAGVVYPAMLFTTAESDSRVDPMHARKMAARLQEAASARSDGPTRPILLRVEAKAGHGAGKPVSKLSEELTDELAFLFRELALSARSTGGTKL